MTTEIYDIQQPVIQLVNDIIEHAIKDKISDIHWEPFTEGLTIRFRRDGLLHVYDQQPKHLAAQIISRLKILAGLDIAEKRLPQDGHFSLQQQDHRVDFRVNVCPTIHGEKVVLRLLDSNQQQLAIDELGLFEQQKRSFIHAISQPQGLVLVTGPTGSGKTVTLYSALGKLNQPEKNISTIEDPVEIKVQGINQVSVNPKIGLNFSTALRAFLRQDPDIIMVGEMRDLETAEIAIKAAQTGHLVLSTLHTNNALESITRLLNMGIPTYQIINCFQLIIAQRLARKLCEHCKIQNTSPPNIRSENVFSANSKGCSACHQGYNGRIGIFEVLPFTDEIKEQILEKDARQLQQRFQQSFISLKQACLERVKQGSTSLEEIYRVTMTDEKENL